MDMGLQNWSGILPVAKIYSHMLISCAALISKTLPPKSLFPAPLIMFAACSLFCRLVAPEQQSMLLVFAFHAESPQVQQCNKPQVPAERAVRELDEVTLFCVKTFCVERI